MKIKDVRSGRQYELGKEMLMNGMTAGLYGIVMNSKYKHDHKMENKIGKQNFNAEKKRRVAEYKASKAKSLKGNAYRAASKVYNLNAKNL